MKTHKIRTLLFSGLLSISFLSAYSQAVDEEVASFRLSDINGYFDSYFSPFATATAVSMGGGWYNTAKTHKLLGIDISLVSLSIGMVPDEDLIVNSADIELGGGLNFSSTGDVPTFSAGDDVTPPDINMQVDYTNNTYGIDLHENQTLFAPSKGAGLPFGGIAPNMFQLGIGLPKGTDIKVRLLPSISQMGIEFKMWGFGVQHDIKQWIPGVKDVPILQLSAVIAYSKLSLSANFSEIDESLTFNPAKFEAVSSLPEATWSDQSLGIDMSSLIGHLLVGINIPVVNPYLGVGFNKYSFDGGLRGSYPVISLRVQGDPTGVDVVNTIAESEPDPINIDVSGNMMNLDVGLRIKLAVITLWGQYTVQKYPVATVGLGLSIR